MNVDMKAYLKVLGDRPWKFDETDVDFHRAAPGEPRCDQCAHYFRRAVDGHAVCEIFRPNTPSEDVLPEGTCKFQTPDGDYFPLYTDDEGGPDDEPLGRGESATGSAEAHREDATQG